MAGPISETPSGGSKPFKKRVPMFSMPRGLATKKDIATVVGSLDRPVNLVMGLEGVQLSLAELSAIGVRPNQRRQRPLSHRAGCRPARRTGNARAGYIYFRKRSGESPGAQPHFRGNRLGKLFYPDAGGGGFAEMHRLSVHAQRHSLVVLAL
jgi:hypothetical protein